MGRAQIWFTDFMIGILIFVIVIFIYYLYAHGIDDDPSEIIADLVLDAKTISSSLVTAGTPADWSADNVQVIGLTDGKQRIIQEKLGLFANISYNQAKTRLRTSYDYYIQLYYPNGTIIPIDSQQGIGLPPDNTTNQVKINRIVIYDSALVNMVVRVWQ